MNDHIAGHGDRTETATDSLTRSSAAALSATLNHETAPKAGEVLPYLWHWIFFRPTLPEELLAEDGHPHKGGFIPDLGLPRRMWAGGRLRFLSPLIIGTEIRRESRILGITEKEGRSGKLAFVTVSHLISCADTLAVVEEQDIVFRAPAVPGMEAPAPVAAPGDARWKREIVPSEVMMFRYSALTFNSHRIHYDQPYATQTEGYPDLVVHGPLIATLLMDLVRSHRPDATVTDFSFKAMRPSFMGNPLHLCGSPSPDGKTVELWSHDHEGWLTMSARAAFA